jgi:myo-inositol-1(or 4)-monophosphatase
LLDSKLPAHLKADAELLFQTVRKAGALALNLAQKNVRRWNKPDGSTVTEADLEIDLFLKSHLMKQRPDYGWLSEETPDTQVRLGKKHLWIVDPIDGTNSFVNGTDGWCIGVALVENTRPILAALYRPAAGEFYHAVKGAGAFCNDEPLKPRDGSTLENAELLGTGRAAKCLIPFGVNGHNAPQIPLLLRLAYVAAGRADIAMSFGNKNDWDLAAGDLLVEESGAKLTDLDGKQMIYNKPTPWQNGMLAAGLNRHQITWKQLEKL